MVDVNIFISHKNKDSVAAEKLKEILENLSPTGDRLKVFVSEHIEGGENWFKWIQKHLVESNLLLLLYTDSSDDWEWCMYEAGLFTDLTDGNTKRVVCIHSTDERPEPLKHLQGVRAEESDIEKFLKDLFIGTNLLKLDEALSPWLEKNLDVVSKRAQEITLLLKRKKLEKNYSGNHLFIEVSDPREITKKKIPPDAIATSDQAFIWSLFDLQPGKWRWEVIEREARKNQYQLWLDELAESMYRATKGKKVHQARATYLSRTEMKNYRPVLYRFDKNSDGSMLFKVLFYEDTSWQFVNVPEQTATLVIALVMAMRMRHEVLTPYIKKFKTCKTELELQNTCTEIQQKISTIATASYIRGLTDEDMLKNVFDDKEGKDSIQEIYDQYRELNERLKESIEKSACEDIVEQLKNMQKPNNRFLDMGIRRFVELNTKVQKEIEEAIK